MRPGWIFLCMMGLIFSPFVGFAIEGKVGEAGLVTGLAFAPLPLLGLLLLMWRQRRAYRALPAALTDQWRHGRVFPPLPAESARAPQVFRKGRMAITLQADGVLVSSPALVGIHRAGRLSHTWVADQAGQYWLSWADVAEWRVESDSDGPDVHRATLVGGGDVSIRHFVPDGASEAALLDAVRRLGGKPVRLLVDIGT